MFHVGSVDMDTLVGLIAKRVPLERLHLVRRTVTESLLLRVKEAVSHSSNPSVATV